MVKEKVKLVAVRLEPKQSNALKFRASVLDVDKSFLMRKIVRESLDK